MEPGNVYLPDRSMPRCAWVNEHVDELCRFPAEPNDCGDSDSQALFEIRNGMDSLQRYLKMSSIRISILAS
jgi:phage terminase large subunit-like protein